MPRSIKPSASSPVPALSDEDVLSPAHIDRFRAFSLRLRRIGLREPELLALALMQPHPIRFGNLVKALGYTSNGTVSDITRRLESRGLCRRVLPGPDGDRRTVSWALTPDGRVAIIYAFAGTKPKSLQQNAG